MRPAEVRVLSGYKRGAWECRDYSCPPPIRAPTSGSGVWAPQCPLSCSRCQVRGETDASGKSVSVRAPQ